jgi:S-adenosylmethionine hydrolase
MSIITLTTDYGSRDLYAASLKGRLIQQAPEASIVDISHDIQPFHLDEAAFLLGHSYHFFPKNSIHIIAVDESRSSRHSGLLMKKDGHWFIGPDNGLFHIMRPEIKPELIIRLDFIREESHFPAFDLYVPAAAHISKGGATEVLGKAIESIVEKKVLQPLVSADNSIIHGNIQHIDRYGNLISNIPGKLIDEHREGRGLNIDAGGRRTIKKLMKFYDEVEEGGILAMINSMGYLEIAINRHSGPDQNGASQLLGLYLRDRIEVYFI